MFTSLMPELLSVKADLPYAISLAVKHGFGGVDTLASHLIVPELDPGSITAAMTEQRLRPGYFSLPPNRVPATDEEWRAVHETLPFIAARAQRLGFTRAALVVLPFHESLPYEEAFAEHVRRIDTLTQVLDDFGIALALEYVSPLSRRAPYTHHFIHDMRGMLTLCDAVASPHVGLLLDSFHWHCAGETVEDIARLSAQRIVVVHINDAPDIPEEAQTVGDRALPGATGVINLKGFVGALRTIGYKGPITCEPMAKAITALNAINDDDIVRQTAVALQETLSRDV